MWIVAGILLGLVVLASLVGFHAGPHAHLAAGILGVAAAAWLIFMAVSGSSAPGLWALLTADLVVSAGVGLAAWSALFRDDGSRHRHHLSALEAHEGVAVSDLDPEGIVRVRGEQWSAVSVNGSVPRGTRVQILRAAGVRLEVWGEEADADPPSADLFRLDDDRQELST
jgi:membrane-bound ClpP family serine protease